jgi:hypothetical protein
MRSIAASNGATPEWSAELLGAVYLILGYTCRLPDPWWLIAGATPLAILPVQSTAQHVNALQGSGVLEARNDTYTAANVATIVLGALLLGFVILVTLTDFGA